MFESETEAGQSLRGNGHSVGTEELRAKWDQTRTQLQDVDRWARQRARDRPFVALAAVIVAGYCIGRLVARL